MVFKFISTPYAADYPFFMSVFLQIYYIFIINVQTELNVFLNTLLLCVFL